MIATTEGAQRAAVVAAARTWIGTKYHHHAGVKGHGVDCAYLLMEAFAEPGLIERPTPPPYPPDWHCHRSEELYVEFILRFTTEFDWRERALRAADIVVWQYGRTFSHGAIVSDWPKVIHAFAPYLMVDETDIRGTDLEVLKDGSPRPMRAFSFW